MKRKKTFYAVIGHAVGLAVVGAIALLFSFQSLGVLALTFAIWLGVTACMGYFD